MAAGQRSPTDGVDLRALGSRALDARRRATPRHRAARRAAGCVGRQRWKSAGVGEESVPVGRATLLLCRSSEVALGVGVVTAANVASTRGVVLLSVNAATAGLVQGVIDTGNSLGQGPPLDHGLEVIYGPGSTRAGI